MPPRLVAPMIGLGGSSALAGLAGVLLAHRARSSVPVPFDLLLLALGVAGVLIVLGLLVGWLVALINRPTREPVINR